MQQICRQPVPQITVNEKGIWLSRVWWLCSECKLRVDKLSTSNGIIGHDLTERLSLSFVMKLHPTVEGKLNECILIFVLRTIFDRARK